MRLVRCGVWQFRACEGSVDCASTVDHSESSVGTLLLLVWVLVDGVAGFQKLVGRVACGWRCGFLFCTHTFLFHWLELYDS